MTSDQTISKTVPRREFIKQLGYTAATAGVMAQSLTVFGQENAQPIALALVGGAHIHTPNYINILKKRKEVKVKYVWDHDQARAQKRAEALGSQVVNDQKAICSDPEIKAV